MNHFTAYWSFAFGAVFLCACSIKHESDSFAEVRWQNDQKLKQKVLVLQKKLQKAEKTLSEDGRAIQQLRVQIYNAQLNAIEAKVECFEKKWQSDPQRLAMTLKKERSNLFEEERQMISLIIQDGFDSLRAQVLLDRILLLITQISDSIPNS
jgi:hypothetical protein